MKVNYFAPEIRIKIWKSSVIDEQFHFSVSHHAKTPDQIGPYYPSRTSAPTEAGAIQAALDSTTSFIENAISKGQEPEDSWLVKNEDF